MTTPTSPERRLHARAFVLSDQAWGTAEPLGATDEILLEGPSGLDVPKRTVDPALESNTPFVMKSDLLNIPPVDIALPVRMRYELGAYGRAIAMLFGTVSNPVQLNGNAHNSNVRWKEDTVGLFGTYAEERMGKIFEAASAKPFKWELNFSDGMLKSLLSMRCDSCIDDSAVNTATQVDAVTLPSQIYTLGIVPMMSHAAVYINAEAGGDVTSETALILDDFSMVFERPLEAGVHVSGSANIIEPLQEGLSGPGIELTLNWPRMTTVNDDFFQTFAAETTQKVAIIFTGPTIAGSTETYKLTFNWPRLSIINIEYPDEPIVRSGMTLRAEEAASNPTGMSGAVPYFSIVSENTVNYLD